MAARQRRPNAFPHLDAAQRLDYYTDRDVVFRE